MLPKFFFVIVFLAGFFLSLKGEGIDNVLTPMDTLVLSEEQVKQKLQIIDELKTSDIRQAVIYAKEALEDAQKLKDKKLIAEALLTLGKCYTTLGADTEALANLSNALALFDEIKDKRNKSETMIELSNIYFHALQFEIALKYYEEAFNCAKAMDNKQLMIKAIIGKGAVYGNTNKLDSALIIFKETFRLSKAINDLPNEVHSLYNMGDVYRFTNRPEKALEIFKSIERDYDFETINFKQLANLYISFTESYLQLNDIKNAKRYRQKIQEIIQIHQNSNHKKGFYYLSFRIDTIVGDLNSAIKNYKRFKQVSDSVSNDKFKESLANFQISYGLKAKEEEIERLRLDNELKDLNIKQRKIVNYGSAVLVFLLLVVVLQTYRSIRKSNKKNKILQSQREELAATNQELTAINDELFTQREELAATNEELAVINDELHIQRAELESTLTVLRDTQNRLISSEKMASLGILAAGVAHEINNPLNFIKGGTLAIENYLKNKLESHFLELSSLFEIIHVGVNRAADIVKSLDHYSRKDDSKTTKVEINTVIESCLTMLSGELNDRISVKKDYANETLIIACKEGKIHQAFLNILSNAIQSIKGDGTISISTGRRSKFIIMMVTDNGCGISKENLSRITDPFYTTKDPGKGTGLGLSITQSIIEEHNGRINFESKVGLGTTVTVHLPLG